MLKVERDECFRQVKWLGFSPNKSRFVDAWKYADLDDCTAENFRHGILPDAEVGK